ncbi:hypothetical protein BGAL_0486g00050 [Botrytis galanthina]|uniref:Uncharacterized protein n=1 Tax=Botrytis galanthina TaxID=278940 RepID=A0A4S8QVB4_9HELO|nr:hypothetical protein BGAL_0486g00050 [Botrytis galanthina]
MVRRLNIGQEPDRASNAELARMLNELCWAIDQRHPLLLRQNDNPHFHVIAAYALLDSELEVVDFEQGTVKSFKIQISRNLNQHQTTRAQYALQALRSAFFAGTPIVENGLVVSITYTPYHSIDHATVGSDLLALSFAGQNVTAIRRAFERGELYCEVIDDRGNILQGRVTAHPPITRRTYFTSGNVLDILGSMQE